MVNFRLPYFARGPSDFWRLRYISLSTWRDYLYISLGGNRGTSWHVRNLTITSCSADCGTALAGIVLRGATTGWCWSSPGCSVRSRRACRSVECSSRAWAGCLESQWAADPVQCCRWPSRICGWLSLEPSSESAELAFRLARGHRWRSAAQHFSGDLMVMRSGAATTVLFVTGCVVGALVFGAHEPVEFLYFQF